MLDATGCRRPNKENLSIEMIGITKTKSNKMSI